MAGDPGICHRNVPGRTALRGDHPAPSDPTFADERRQRARSRQRPAGHPDLVKINYNVNIGKLMTLTATFPGRRGSDVC